MQFWLLMSAVAVLDVLGISLGKAYTLSQKPWLFVGAVISYTFMGALLVMTLHYKGLAIANILWASFTVIAATMIAYFYFKESITPVQFIGIGLTLIGILLVNR